MKKSKMLSIVLSFLLIFTTVFAGAGSVYAVSNEVDSSELTPNKPINYNSVDWDDEEAAFDVVYDAMSLFTVEEEGYYPVNISKKGTNFCPVEKIEENGLRIFNNLHKSNFLKGLEGDEFTDKFVELYCELNYLHPFREGNGRIQRLFLSMLLKHNEKKIDFTAIDENLFMIATIKSISGDIFILKDIFKEHITSLD